MALGHFPGESPDAPFNMAVMGLRLAAMSNGVSSLHGQVSREMFQPLWPNIPAEEVPDRLGDQRRAPADLGVARR